MMLKCETIWGHNFTLLIILDSPIPILFFKKTFTLFILSNCLIFEGDKKCSCQMKHVWFFQVTVKSVMGIEFNFEKVRLMFSIFYMGEVNEEGYILKHVRYKCNEMLSLQCLAR